MNSVHLTNSLNDTTGETTMTTLTMEQLKANMKAKAAAAMAEAQQKLMASDSFQNAMMNQMQKELATEKLREIESSLKAIPTLYPEVIERGEKKGQVREWRDNYLYNLGIDVQIVYNIIKGLQYSSTMHKGLMKGIINLSDSFIEELSSAFGTQAYFQLSTGEYHEEIPMNYHKVVSMMTLLQAELGVIFNLDLLTEQSVLLQWEASRARAQLDYTKYVESISNKEAHFITC